MLEYNGCMTSTELRQFIKSRGLTQRQLADVLGIGRIVVNQWVNGKRKISGRRELQIKALYSKVASFDTARLQNYLARYGMNAASFAEFYGVKKSTVNSWLKGKSPLPGALLQFLLYEQAITAQGQSLSPAP